MVLSLATQLYTAAELHYQQRGSVTELARIIHRDYVVPGHVTRANAIRCLHQIGYNPKTLNSVWPRTASIAISAPVNSTQSRLNELVVKHDFTNRLPGWKFEVTNTIRGYAYHRSLRITVPLWAFKRGIGYVEYYLCHEAAHAFGNYNHGPAFMAKFKQICPVDLQHFELEYKPRNAKKAGIAMPSTK